MIPLIKETTIKTIDLTELDFIVQDELMGENPDGHDYDHICVDTERSYWKDGDHCSIDMFMEKLQELKDAGATHVQVCQHCDHHGYYLTGSILEVASKEEAHELRVKRLQEKIKLAEAQQEQNGNYLAQEDEKIAKMWEELQRMTGEGDPRADADNIS